jgi:predicted SnoaL-like aldol condensation-catalyzing enzyme
MATPAEDRNRAFVLEAFDTLFNRRDYAAAQSFWSPDYIQHSAHIAPGRDGLFALVKAAPSNMRYESGLAIAGGELSFCTGGSATSASPPIG